MCSPWSRRVWQESNNAYLQFNMIIPCNLKANKQNIKSVYRIFASCARFLYVKHACETLSLETSGLGDLQMKQSLKCMRTHESRCCSPLFCIHRENEKSLLRVPQLATQYMIDDEEHLAVGKSITSPYTHYKCCYCWAATLEFAHS